MHAQHPQAMLYKAVINEPLFYVNGHLIIITVSIHVHVDLFTMYNDHALIVRLQV